MTKRQEQTWHRLQTIADQADARYTAVCMLYGRTRWTLSADQERIPAIHEARAWKIVADSNLLTYMRWLEVAC